MSKALVVLSGGQDSTTCLAIAMSKHSEVIALTFDYGQRHYLEIYAARGVTHEAGVKWNVRNVTSIFEGSKSKLLQSGDVSSQHEQNPELPASFVPGRNIIFLAIAGSFAYTHNCRYVYIGANQTDYSGYPDCRGEFLQHMELALLAGLDRDITIKAPLLNKTKAETVLLMKELGKLSWLKYTHTCYNNQQPPCNNCPACKLRAKGFKEAGIIDPLMEA